ncbi:hypothetical protein [Phytohabitans aurantiacus]|nr:hypothetical protein [Phytohabitans aurantiacus]
MLSTATVAMSVVSAQGPGDMELTLPICATAVPLALYLGRFASMRSAFLTRVIPAGVGSSALLYNIAHHGGWPLTVFSAAICAVFLLTCTGKLLHRKFGAPADTSDPEDLRQLLAEAEVRERDLLNRLACLESGTPPGGDQPTEQT